MSAEKRDTEGGTSKRSVMQQARKLRVYLKEHHHFLEKIKLQRADVPEGEEETDEHYVVG